MITQPTSDVRQLLQPNEQRRLRHQNGISFLACCTRDRDGIFRRRLMFWDHTRGRTALIKQYQNESGRCGPGKILHYQALFSCRMDIESVLCTLHLQLILLVLPRSIWNQLAFLAKWVAVNALLALLYHDLHASDSLKLDHLISSCTESRALNARR